MYHATTSAMKPKNAPGIPNIDVVITIASILITRPHIIVCVRGKNKNQTSTNDVMHCFVISRFVLRQFNVASFFVSILKKMGNNTSSTSAHTAKESTLHERNVRYIHDKQFTISVVVSGPPELDVDVLCRYLTSPKSPLVYMSVGYDTDINIEETFVDSSVQKTRFGEEETAQRLQCRKIIHQNEQYNKQRAREAAGSHTVLFETLLRQANNYTLRHMINIPPTSLLTIPEDVRAQNFQTYRWRLFRTSVLDILYGQMPSAVSYGLIDDHQRNCLDTLCSTAFQSMLRDCSPSNTVFVYIMPTARAYDRIVQKTMDNIHEQPRRSIVRRMMWQCYNQMQQLYNDPTFSKTYWSVVFALDDTVLLEAYNECVSVQLLAWIVARRRAGLWGSVWDVRRKYLASQEAQTFRFITIPVQQTNRLAAKKASDSSPDDNLSTLHQEIDDDEFNPSGVLQGATRSSVQLSKRTGTNGETTFERTEVFTMPTRTIVARRDSTTALSRTSSSTNSNTSPLQRTNSGSLTRTSPSNNTIDTTVGTSVMLDVIDHSNGFRTATTPNLLATKTTSSSSKSTSDGWASRGATFIGTSGDD